MIGPLLYKWFRPGKVAGITLVDQDGQPRLSSIVLKSTKGNIKLVDTYEALSFEEMSKQLKGIPAVLYLHGNGVLVKPASYYTDDEEQAALKEAFPGLSFKDVLVHGVVNEQLNNSWLSLVRKSLVDEQIDQLEQLGINVIGLGVGVAPFAVLSKVLEPSRSIDLTIQHYKVSISQQDLTNVEKSTNDKLGDPLKIGEESIPKSLIMPYASVLSYLASEDQLLSIFRTERALDQSYVENKAIHNIGKWSLISVFIVLLINFGVFSIYFNSNRALQGEVQSVLDNKRYLKELEGRLDRSRSLLLNEGWMGSSKVSYYANRIAISVPNNILLDRLMMFPEEEKKRGDFSRPKYIDDQLIIVGRTNDDEALNKWVLTLNTLVFVERVTVRGFDREAGAKEAVFNLEVIIK